MSRRALRHGQRADLIGHVETAIAEVRACIECAPGCGPLLVQAYRCLSELGRLRETIDELPTIDLPNQRADGG